MAGAYPIGADAHVDVPLSNYASRAFNTAEDAFIADQLFPSIPVGKQSDKYYVIEKGAFFRIPTTLRAPRTKAKRVQFQVSSDSFFADNYALAADWALEDEANADMGIDLARNSTDLALIGLRMDQEARVANLVSSISNVGSGAALSGATAWSAVKSADLLAQTNTAHAFIRSSTGLVPNTLVVDYDSLQLARRNERLVSSFYKVQQGELTNEQLMQVFKVDRILVGKGVKNTAGEGAADSMSSIWPNVALFCHVGMATGLRSATFGGRFRWKPANVGTDMSVRVQRFNEVGGENIGIAEASYFQDEKVIARDLSYLYTGTI